MNWKKKACGICGLLFQPDGSRRLNCPKCRNVVKTYDPKMVTVAVDGITFDSEGKAEKFEPIEKIFGGKSAGYAKTCIDCKKVPEGKFCKKRCL